jgi:hypothetical protein
MNWDNLTKMSPVNIEFEDLPIIWTKSKASVASAIAAMVAGIAGWFWSFFVVCYMGKNGVKSMWSNNDIINPLWLVPVICGILAVIFGIVALNNIRRKHYFVGRLKYIIIVGSVLGGLIAFIWVVLAALDYLIISNLVIP